MSEEPTRDFEKMFDLDRSTMMKDIVDRMETCFRQAQASRDDLKEIIAGCREQEISPRDIDAMQQIARLRLEDKGGTAREKLQALDRIGKAVGFDVLDWR